MAFHSIFIMLNQYLFCWLDYLGSMPHALLIDSCFQYTRVLRTVLRVGVLRATTGRVYLLYAGWISRHNHMFDLIFSYVIFWCCAVDPLKVFLGRYSTVPRRGQYRSKEWNPIHRQQMVPRLQLLYLQLCHSRVLQFLYIKAAMGAVSIICEAS